MAPPQQPQQPQGDNSLAPLWIAIAIIIAGAMIWYYAHSYIVATVLAVRSFEIDVISLFTPDLKPLGAIINATPSSSYSDVTFNELTTISTQVGMYLRYPVAGILLIVALLLYFRNPILNLRKTYDIQRLIDQEKAQWPQIQSVAEVNLVDQDIHQGPWAMALTPMEFAKQHRLLEERYLTPSDHEGSQKPVLVAEIIRSEAQRIFSMQLGRYWEGYEHLPIYARALFAVFAARVESDAEGANALMHRMAQSMNKGGTLDCGGADDLFKKHQDNKHIQKLYKRHAFEYTVLSSLLLLARDDGVLPASDFLWLKTIDRQLWYVLNSIGRRTCFVEAAGPFAHWLAELRYGHRIRVPMINTAVDALDIAVKEIRYHRDDEDAE